VKVNLHPSISPKPSSPARAHPQRRPQRHRGRPYEIQARVVILKEQLDAERALVTLRADEDKSAHASPCAPAPQGPAINCSSTPSPATSSKSSPERSRRPHLEEVPDIGYENIGGLGDQIEAIKDAVELPYLYADYYKEHKLTPPKACSSTAPPVAAKT